VLDLTEHDFQDIFNVTGRIFEIGVRCSSGLVSTVVCSNSEILKQDPRGKHSWLNACNAKELSERVRHVLSACSESPLTTSVCVLTRQSMPIDMSLLKDFCCVLTVPNGGLVHQQQKDGSWIVVQSPERLRVLYCPSAVDRVSGEAGMLTCKVLASSAAKGSSDAKKKKVLHMMFSGRAAAAKANILFDTGASNNFVSKTFAKQAGITVRPVEYFLRLADDKTTEVAGQATVYVQLGAFYKPVKCYVMDMLYEVDLILGEEFLDKYDCMLHYGKGCIMIRKGKRHLTVNSPALPRNQLLVDEEKFDSVLSASQVKRLARKGARVFLAVIRPVESDPVPPVVGSVAALSPDVPTSFVQPNQAAGPPGGEVPWVSELLSEFFEVFQDPLPPGLPPERSEGHSISTEPGHPPPLWSMYCLSPLKYQELEKQVTKFLKDGILEVSQSPYGAPVLFVPKPNGQGLRPPVDYRALNSITVKNCCTIPRIDDLLDAVAGSASFTSLDLTSGYHQILISKENRPKTAFRTPFGHFQFKVLIEGLTNAPATFQTVMNSILHPYIRKFVVVYIDDILIFSKIKAEHQARVRLVFEVLRL
jgi:hypothetical protein